MPRRLGKGRAVWAERTVTPLSPPPLETNARAKKGTVRKKRTRMTPVKTKERRTTTTRNLWGRKGRKQRYVKRRSVMA